MDPEIAVLRTSPLPETGPLSDVAYFVVSVRTITADPRPSRIDAVRRTIDLPYAVDPNRRPILGIAVLRRGLFAIAPTVGVRIGLYL